jgi:hypothetical protein
MVEVNDEGKEALTLFRVLRRFGDFATIVERARSPVVPTRSACTPCMPGT